MHLSTLVPLLSFLSSFALSSGSGTRGAHPIRQHAQWYQAALERRAAISNTTTPLRNVNVAHPPVVPKGGRKCEVLLLKHDFANSYYAPAIVDYVPPTRCGEVGKWAAVVLNITVTSNGTQFDRLGSISLSNVEIWRTSTAEPTKTGIIWTALKDVTKYNPVFSKKGRLMFDENNINDATYTGIFSTTLTAVFYEATPDFPTPKSADLIIPLSTLSSTQSQMFTYPGDSSTSITIPANTAEAYVEIYATGNSDEEFWYTNLPDEFSDEFDADAGLIGKGPFREVQLLIDGALDELDKAGVVIPFPVIYTGGANPLLWRPIASLRAFDIPTFYIDITPYIPLLSDDLPHNFTLIVLGQGLGDHSVNANWFLSGNIQIMLDPSPERTTGLLISHEATPFAAIQTLGGPSSDNTTFTTDVSARRTLNIVAIVNTGSGAKLVHFSQIISYSNQQVYSRDGLNEAVTQNTKVLVTSNHGEITKLSESYSFPLSITTNYESYPNSYAATVGPYAYDRVYTPPPGAGRFETTKSSQTGSASITRDSAGTAYVGDSKTSENYDFVDALGVREYILPALERALILPTPQNTFHEEIKAINSTIVSDAQSGSLASGRPAVIQSPPLNNPPLYPGEVKNGLAQIVGMAMRPVAGGLARKTKQEGGFTP
ncbi:hypothetical protein P7C70_g7405, partial [Phenoliferia sp. Uapishka_3]